MAPAAADTILQHLQNSEKKATDYDLICTGDLGSHGHCLLSELLKKEHVVVEEQLQDSGMWIYQKKQDIHAGGSGCGCSATVWSSYLLDALRRGKYQRILLVGTGALLSPVSIGQGHAIPAIAHAVEIVKEGNTVCG
jgi:stage V sporulation protein AD